MSILQHSKHRQEHGEASKEASRDHRLRTNNVSDFAHFLPTMFVCVTYAYLPAQICFSVQSQLIDSAREHVKKRGAMKMLSSSDCAVTSMENAIYVSVI